MAFDKTQKEKTERKYYFFEDSKTIAFKKKELSEEDKKWINFNHVIVGKVRQTQSDTVDFVHATLKDGTDGKAINEIGIQQNYNEGGGIITVSSETVYIRAIIII
jgi:hypothetical protein